MSQIAKLGHVALVTPDLEKSLWFFDEVLGLERVEESGGTVYLRGWGEFEHHSLSLTEGEEALVDHIGWRTHGPDELSILEQQLHAQDIAIAEVSAGYEAGQGRAIRFQLPAGDHPFELYFDVEKPEPPEGRRSRLKNNSYRPWGHGASPRRIDHVNLWTDDASTAEDWLADHLGFKTREYIRIDGTVSASWMAVTSLVHDVAVMTDPEGRPARFHHLAYYFDNWQDILRAMDILAENDVDIDLGPGRHGISQAFFCYVRDPGSGHRVELFSGGYHIFDPDWEPVEWGEQDMKAGLIWWGEEQPGPGHPLALTTRCAPLHHKPA